MSNSEESPGIIKSLSLLFPLEFLIISTKKYDLKKYLHYSNYQNNQKNIQIQIHKKIQILNAD